MPAKVLQPIVEAVFRANPNYELVLFDRLPTEQREVLSDLQKDPDFYGILHPGQSVRATLKSICRDTALLYYTLREPGRLPAYVQKSLGQTCNQTIAELVLDGVLEIESDGTFVSGSQAYPLIYQERPFTQGTGAIAQLSVQALQYAQALEITESAQLSARLYAYNRLPITPAWKRKLPTSEAVGEYLGIQGNRSLQRLLEQDWLQVSPPPPYDGWLAWKSRHAQPTPPSTKLTYKLYISPPAEFMREVLETTVTVLTEVQAPHFKVGKDVYGLLRPDKLMAYFWDFEALQKAADQLLQRLKGIPVQGVPFTAEWGGEGLLSWGIDPPEAEQVLRWQGRESWRLWVTNHLATALLAAKSAQPAVVEPWQFALERLQLEGIDTETWAPTAEMWGEYAAMEA